MLIRRYLIKEVLITFLAVTTVIFFIALSNKFVRLIAQAASGQIAPDVLLQVLMFQMPELLGFLLPIGLFMAILLSYSRCFADNEIPVLLACGISWQKLCSFAAILGVIVMFITGSITCYLSPILAQKRENLVHDQGPLLLLQTVTPGRFHTFSKGEMVFYVAGINNERTKLEQVFIAEQPHLIEGDEDWRLFTAKSGQVTTDPETERSFVKLNNGKRYQGKPGERDYSVLEFDQYQRSLAETPQQQGIYYHRTMPTKMLWKHSMPSNVAELQWRLSIPIAGLLLPIIAVPLSRVRPRAGRFGRLFIGIIICIVYFNLLTLSKRWIALGVLPPFIGVWWVHILLLLSSLLYIAKVSGRFEQFLFLTKRRLLS